MMSIAIKNSLSLFLIELLTEIIQSGEMDFVDVKIPSKISSTFYTQFGDNIAYFFIVLFFLIGYSTSKLIKD